MNDYDEFRDLNEEVLQAKTARELYKIAQALKVRNYTHFKKDELIAEILSSARSVIRNEKVAEEPEQILIQEKPKEDIIVQAPVEEEPVKERHFTERRYESEREREPARPAETNVTKGLFELHPDGYGFLRSNYFPTFSDVYVSPPLIRRYGLKTGDTVVGVVHKPQREGEKYPSLVSVVSIDGIKVNGFFKRNNFESLTPYYPTKRIVLETPGCNIALRVLDLIAPLGKGQRGLIVSAPKAGKTTLMKEIAKSVAKNSPEINLMILLIDERPEEVTDMKNSVAAEVISSTFDQPPENHIRVVELAIEKAKRLVEVGKDVMILLDGITRLTRAYNLLSSSTGKTLSGGLDPAAIKGPKKFLGAARSITNGGSLTILATALIDTGSRLDQVIYEEFKGTGNMEIILDRELAEQRIFPAVDIKKSGTRKEELLYTAEEYRKIWALRKFIGELEPQEALERLIEMLEQTHSNEELLRSISVQNDR
ncbi:MAG: transcription termination factor Rho [Caldisericaceae bacterium]